MAEIIKREGVTLKLNKNITRTFEKLLSQWNASLGRDIITMMKLEISSGKSPLKKGGGQTGEKARFQKYSDRYIQWMKEEGGSKRPRPVNLYLSGKMLTSITAKKKNKNTIVVECSDEKAVWHNETGAGKSRVTRRFLPSRPGDELSRTIEKAIEAKLEKMLKDAF